MKRASVGCFFLMVIRQLLLLGALALLLLPADHVHARMPLAAHAPSAAIHASDLLLPFRANTMGGGVVQRRGLQRMRSLPAGPPSPKPNSLVRRGDPPPDPTISPMPVEPSPTPPPPLAA
ncbi:hypothetical protein ACLOJK_024644 [Asimina triloba]